MAIYVIGDLHLSFSTNKPMEIFGEKWYKHYDKIKADWDEKVKSTDSVILAGDSSWAMNLDEFQADIDFIGSMAGNKYFLKGNHDYWWSTLSKMKKRFPDVNFIYNNSYVIEDKVIVGTRGWDYYPNEDTTSKDNTIFFRECLRLENSIKSVSEEHSHLEKICILHYPPFTIGGKKTRLNEIIEENGIQKVYFGHVHSNHELVTTGEVDGVTYTMISADYVDFKLHRIED